MTNNRGLCMAAGIESTDDLDVDGLPRWMQHPEYGYHHCGDRQMLFAFCAMTYGFNIPEFDLWLSGLRACPGRSELLQRRKDAFDSCWQNDDLALLRHLEFMQLRQFAFQREDFLFPLAQTGKKVRSPFQDANQERSAKSEALRKEWQRRADAKWAEPQHACKSAKEIARLIAGKDENPDLIRRRIKKLA